MAYIPKGKDYLKARLSARKSRIDVRYKFYDMKHIPRALLKNTPASIQALMPAFGWCSMAVDAIYNRMFMNGFDDDSDVFGFNTIYEMNNSDILFDSAIKDSLISACSFIYVSKDDDDMPRMEVIDAGNATGIMDTTTGLLHEGYAILDTSDGAVLLDGYFLPDRTEFTEYEKGSPKRTWSIPNPTGYPLLVPIVYQPDAKREFGRSAISRGMMACQDAAARSFLDACVASGIGSLPQKYITGLADDVEIENSFDYAVTRLLALYRDENGNVPQPGQFAQINTAMYMDTMRLQASVFAGHSDLMVDDLGFVSANPSSEEAIKASHDRLKRKALRAQRSMGVGFKNAGFVAACLRDDTKYYRDEIARVKPLWRPIDHVSPSTMSIIGDGAIKLNQAVPDFITAKTLGRMTGIDTEE